MAENDVTVSDSAATKIAEILQAEEKAGAKLRISVDGGGCSGFQYKFDIEFDDENSDSDLILKKSGATIVIDKDVSLGFVEGAVIDLDMTLGGWSFAIKNPNATANCGCGNSFSV